MFGDDDPFLVGVGRLQFAQKLKDIFKAVHKQKWKVRLTFWNPSTGEE